MTFGVVLAALRDGKRVRRSGWGLPGGLASQLLIGAGNEAELRVADLLASDWELVEEPAASCGDRLDYGAGSWCFCQLPKNHPGLHRCNGKEWASFCMPAKPRCECTCTNPAGQPHHGCPALHFTITRLERELAASNLAAAVLLWERDEARSKLRHVTLSAQAMSRELATLGSAKP